MKFQVFNSLLFLPSLLMFNSCFGYPRGAPLGVCDSMTPHHGVGAQTLNTSPFSIDVNSAYYKTGQIVKVTISSNGTYQFKGILIQARSEKSNTTAIGSFVNIPASTKHLECNSNSKGAVTHKQRLNISSVTLDWMPPEDISAYKNISFFATVVKEKTIFWVQIPSSPLMRDASCPPGKPTCNAGTAISVLYPLLLFLILAIEYILF